MPDRVLSTTYDTSETGAALDAKRIAAAWLVGCVVFPNLLTYVHLRVGPFSAPFTVAELAPFETAFGFVCAVLFFVWRWPRVFGLSRLRPRVSDLAVGVLAGYLAFNVSVLIPEIPITWPWAPDFPVFCPYRKLLFVCQAVVIPVAEEVVFRGVILGSLSKRMPALWAVVITAAAATAVHDGPNGFLMELVIGGIYLARHRSLPASIAAHTATNALVWFPHLMFAGYLLK